MAMQFYLREATQYPLLQEIVEQRLTSEELLEKSFIAEFHLVLQNNAMESELAEAKTLLTASFVSESEMQEAMQSPLLQKMVEERRKDNELKEKLRTAEFQMSNDCRSDISSPIKEPCEMIKRAVPPHGTDRLDMERCKRVRIR